jgi:hypothetical protein
LLLRSLEGDIFKILFVKVHVVSGGIPATTLPPASGRATFATFAAPSEELDVVGHDVYLAALGAVLGLPGTVLKAAFDEDRVALLLIVGDGLAQLPPSRDVEEVHLFVFGAHPVYREPKLADRDSVIREPQLWVPSKIPRENHPVKANHALLLFSNYL